MRQFPARGPTTAHPRIVRRGGGVLAREAAPLYLPDEEASPLAPLHLPPENGASLHLDDPHASAPEFLPAEVFDGLLTEIFKRPEDADTEREFSQELPPLPKANPVVARPRATPQAHARLKARATPQAQRAQPPPPPGSPLLRAAPMLEPRGAGRAEGRGAARAAVPMQRSPRSSAASLAAVRPIDLPEVRDRRPRGSARHAAEAGVPLSDPRFDRPPAPFQPPPLRPVHPPPYQASPDRSGAPVGPDDPRFPLLHQEEPLAFGGDVLRRAATAVEPALAGRSVRQPRTILFAGTAAALVAAAIVLVAALEIAESQRVRAKEIASTEGPSDHTDGPRLTRVALSAEESSRAIHRKSAQFRDLWRSEVWYHPLTGKRYLPENPTRKFGARRSAHGRPAECGRGHCGVDMGEFGLDVHAVRDGVIEKIQWQPRNNAGKYIRIEHDDGFTSYYIHLHRIRKDLEVGMRVHGGEEIGVTGKTGVKRSRPHLHFALSYKEGREKIFIDPEPVLRRSIWSLDDTIAAETANASIVASSAAALNDDVEAGREDKVHERRHEHSAEDDRPE